MSKTRLQKINTLLGKMNSPPYRLNQIKDAIYKSGIEEYSEIKVLPQKIRHALSRNLGNQILTLKSLHEIKGGQAHKVLFETADKQKIETVRMLFRPSSARDAFHSSLCISSQSGCALACKFCATGAIGFKKNLTADEIVDQVLHFKKRRLSVNSVSFMGMGEPLANPNIWDSLEILSDPKQIGISRHKISVSTVGIIPGIEKLIEEYPQVNLAFSLHSPFENQRRQIMPISKAYPIKAVMKYVRKYVETTNNKIFIAYALIQGINDSIDHSKALVDLIKSQGSSRYLYHVNLIRFNPAPVIKDFKRPERNTVNAFMKIISNSGLNVTLRQSFGLDIYAACGQLYGKENSVF